MVQAVEKQKSILDRLQNLTKAGKDTKAARKN
jgi:hypothetical protein